MDSASHGRGDRGYPPPVVAMRSWSRRLAVLGLMAAFCLGCASKILDKYTSRIGTLTYDEALIELGPPNHVADLDNGGKVADWLQQSSRVYSTPSTAVVVGSWPNGVLVSPGGNIGSTPSVYLLLTFGPDHRLTAARLQYK
ncbi:MAG: hypothetical protein ACKO3H_02590 [Verrucomicrobiota bacterium]